MFAPSRVSGSASTGSRGQCAATRRRDLRDHSDRGPSGDRPLRVALLSYRSKPHCGGQGIYLRHLSRELAALGHHVEVFSGQPYPELEPGPALRTLPSLDLYRDDDPFRTPRPREFRDWIDVLEVGCHVDRRPSPSRSRSACGRCARCGPAAADFDIVHDNQVLAYGMLGHAPRLGLPLVTSIHHPISVDRRIELAAARGLSRLTKWRWYSFVRMQARVARRVGPILTGVRVLPRRHLPRLQGPARERQGHPARRRHPAVPSRGGAPGARPDRRRGQRRLAGEGRRDAAAGVRQARHRTGRRS